MPIREQDVKTVTTAGVPERLVDMEIMPLAAQLVIIPLPDNDGSIYVGDYDTLASAFKGQKLDVASGVGDEFTLSLQQPFDIWIDATASGEGVRWMLIDD